MRHSIVSGGNEAVESVTAQLQAGETVLIHGATGGIGTMAIQLAKALGARVATTADRLARCKEAVLSHNFALLADCVEQDSNLMHAVMTKALRLEWDDRDDPIVELPSPDDFDAVTFARD